MGKPKILAGLLLMAGIGGLVIWMLSPRIVEGQVLHGGRPQAGVRVQVQGATSFVLTNDEGRFQLAISRPGLLTFAREGFIIASHSAASPVRVEMVAVSDEDNPHYAWIAPEANIKNVKNCGNCHGEIEREWSASGHARAGKNPRFLDLIRPKDGRQEWNLAREHPDGLHVCAKCHLPTFSPADADYDPHKAEGLAAQGVHCDLCHKVADVSAEKLGTRFGIDGLDLRRPSDDRQRFFGAMPDAVRPGEEFVYAPAYKESRYCASCHEGVIFGNHVYGTFSEWEQSPARKAGQSCQSCHMTPTGRMNNIAPGKGGIDRDPHTLASHAMPGATLEMLKKSLQLGVQLERLDQEWKVRTELTARDVGHRVPTGFIDHHVILVLEARNLHDIPIPATTGPKLGREVGPALASEAGKVYAKMLVDETGRSPIPFWLSASKTNDTRLHPEQPDRHDFSWPPGATSVRVRVIYRRMWIQVRNDPDNEIVVHDQKVMLR